MLLEQDGSLQKAVGVEFIKDGITKRLKNVRRDVVLSAGTQFLCARVVVDLT